MQSIGNGFDWWFGASDVLTEGTWVYPGGGAVSDWGYVWAAVEPKGDTATLALDYGYYDDGEDNAKSSIPNINRRFCCEKLDCVVVGIAAIPSFPPFATAESDNTFTLNPTLPSDIGTHTWNVTRTYSDRVLSNSMITLIVTADNTCESSTLALAGNIFIASPTRSLGYSVGGTRTTLAWTDAEVVHTLTTASDVCGAYVWTLKYQSVDLTTTATETFSMDAAGALSVYTTDPTDVGTHTLTVTVYL
jgi:hypothetical protein